MVHQLSASDFGKCAEFCHWAQNNLIGHYAC